MTDRQLQNRIKKLKELQQEIDQLQAQADIQKKAIKDEMESRSVEELQAGDAVVRYKTITSTRFDAKAFRESHDRLYQQFTRQTETRRFQIA